MKIAVISTMLGQPWTGSEELWAAMTEAALQQGHEVDISLWRWPDVPQQVQLLQRAGARVSFRPRPKVAGKIYKAMSKRLKRLPLPYPARFSAFREIMRARPNVICLSQGWVYEFADNIDLVRRLNESKIPLVVVNQANPETPVNEDLRFAGREFVNSAAKVAFVSQGNLDTAERQMAQKIPHAIVVRNPVNMRDLGIVPWPNSSDSVWNMACVGRLECAHKAQDILLEALGGQQWRGRSWKLRFFGGGDEKPYLEELIWLYGLEKNVEFGGYASDVRAIWADHQLLVLPSRTEGTPLAMVEAMLCGRPALVSDVAGFPEWVDEGVTGFIAPGPSAASISAALERAWDARANCQTMGLAAHRAALDRYDPNPGQTLLRILQDTAHVTSPASL